ncbi:BatD family protein [Candidatus Seribacter sulfatis]|uniref:BatD family protein n=1 Tax=Candidatus Seribacter sulfatis TaxID=3381756 RepID=UPI00389A98BD
MVKNGSTLSSRSQSKLWIILFVSLLLPGIEEIHGQQLRVESSFQPPSITIANNSVYKIIIHGSQENPQGSLPQIPGISISNSPQTFRSASFINGVPSVRLEMSFQIKPKKIGTHTIPPWTIKVGSTTLQVPGSSIKVVAANQEDKIKQQAEERQKEDLSQASFIEFINPRKFLFEGETVSGLLNLFIWDRLPVSRIERPPQKEGDAFSLTELRQPQEKRNQTKYGKTYTVFSWPTGLTAAIAGQQQIQFNTSIRVRVKSRGNSPFTSPFFNDPFFGFGREESLTVKSDLINIEVRELPMIERPDSFRGAIGKFSCRSIPDSDRVSLGDPIRLVVEITGTGNFSAMPAPVLNSNSNFKIGPPAFSFEGNEITMHEGKQLFEYILTPLKPGLISIPVITFSYFDPAREEYFTSKTNNHPLRVDPGETWVDPTPVQQQTETSDFAVSTTDLFQTENEPGEWFQNVKHKTVINSQVFWSLQSIPLFCAIGLGFYGWKRKQSGRDLFRQRQSILKKQMKESITFNDASLFFRATRERLRLEIGTFYKHPNPSSLSSNELTTLLRSSSNEEDTISEIEKILEISDDHEFAGTLKDPQSLEDLYKHINNLLKKIQ